MVSLSTIVAHCHGLAGMALACDEQAQTLLNRLDPVNRARVLMALLGLVLIGLTLMAMIWILGRRMRRIARQKPPASRVSEDQWYRKPLSPPSDSTASGEGL